MIMLGAYRYLLSGYIIIQKSVSISPNQRMLSGLNYHQSPFLSGSLEYDFAKKKAPEL
jgi:hypothetical protein